MSIAVWEMSRGEWRRAERAQRPLGPRQLRVRVRAASLNYRDLVLLRRIADGAAPPIIPLSDGAGEVIEAGAEVTSARPGDRVAACFFAEHWQDGPPSTEKTAYALGGGTADGTLAREVALHEDAVVPVPTGYSFEEAATLPCAAVTTWNALFVTGQLRPGQTLLLQGTGGVSIFGLQLGAAAGARTIVTSSSDDKLARVRALGATETVNYLTTPGWDDRALELTEGAGVDHLLEVGGTETLARSVRAVRPGGIIVLIGGLTGYERDQATLDAARERGIRVERVYVGSRRMFVDLNETLLAQRIHPVIDRVFSFDEAREALAHLARGAHFGKIVIAV